MNDAETNPYRPPPEIETGSVVFCDRAQMPTETPDATFVVPGPRDAPPRLSFFPDKLVLDRGPSKTAMVITRDAFSHHCNLFLGLFVRTIDVRASERVVIPLPKAALREVRRWIDPIVKQVLARTLAARLRFGLPLGALMLVFSLPILTPRIDALGVAWAAALFALSGIRRFVTHRALLLGDAVVWALLFALNVRSFSGHGSAFTLAMCVGAVFFAAGALRAFAFFGPRRAEDSA